LVGVTALLKRGSRVSCRLRVLLLAALLAELLLREMVSHDTAGGSTDHGVMPRHMARDGADGGSFQAALRLDGARAEHNGETKQR
jgi:hypothetical protein